ncbi:MAG: signal peptide peptidase SppA [Clostridiales bacterium]|nr:signal peptide peptidase SppA [Clostridiales bacterium]
MNENEYENGYGYGEKSAGGKEKKKEKKEKNHSLRNSLLVLAGIVLVLALIGVSCSSIMQSGDVEVKLPNDKYIATLYFEGTIARGNADTWGNPYGYQHSWTLGEIDRLIGDTNNRGLILFVDSPGGGVYECDELYFKIKKYKEKTGNPVYSSMASMAASGGYYISAPADKIFANRNCWTGSIGVTIGTMIDISGLLENYGVKTTTIASGKNKSMGSYFDPLTDEQEGILQSLVDEAYDQFAGIVAEGRGLDIEEVRKIADGRIYTAAQALDLGLVDVIGTYDDAVADMQGQHDLLGCKVVDIRYKYRSFISNILGSAMQRSAGASSDAAAIMALLDKQNKAPVSYLCQMLAE